MYTGAPNTIEEDIYRIFYEALSEYGEVLLNFNLSSHIWIIELYLKNKYYIRDRDHITFKFIIKFHPEDILNDNGSYNLQKITSCAKETGDILYQMYHYVNIDKEKDNMNIKKKHDINNLFAKIKTKNESNVGELYSEIVEAMGWLIAYANRSEDNRRSAAEFETLDEFIRELSDEDISQIRVNSSNVVQSASVNHGNISQTVIN